VKLSLFSACFLAFASRGRFVCVCGVCGVFGEFEIFRFFEGEGKAEGDGPGFNATNLCGVDIFGVDIFGVEDCDWYPGEEPPYKERSY
jgi:hypothetical protein